MCSKNARAKPRIAGMRDLPPEEALRRALLFVPQKNWKKQFMSRENRITNARNYLQAKLMQLI
jgi:hypothetical protein